MRPVIGSGIAPVLMAKGAVSVEPRPVTHGMRCAAGLEGHPLQLVGDVLPQTRGRVEEHAQPAEEDAAELGVVSKRWQQQLVAAGHVEACGGCDLFEIRDGRRESRWRRRARVDVQRAAVVERQAEVVAAAKGVVPGQPVAQHRGIVGEERHHRANLLLIGRAASAAC